LLTDLFSLKFFKNIRVHVAIACEHGLINFKSFVRTRDLQMLACFAGFVRKEASDGELDFSISQPFSANSAGVGK
jgi:hypothetical protein